MVERCVFCRLEKVKQNVATCTQCILRLSIDKLCKCHFESNVNTFLVKKCKMYTIKKPLFPRIKQASL